MKTDTLIGLLVSDARSHARFGQTVMRAAAIATVIALAVFLAVLRPRQDFVDAAGTARFLFKFTMTLPLAVAALGLMDRLGRPAASTSAWVWFLLALAVALACGVGLELWVVPASDWGARLVGHNARYCLAYIPLIAIGPLACFIAALRHGAPSRPGLAGAVAGLAASGIAATLYATHCPDDSPLFVATWYLIATSVVVLVGYAAGRWFLRY